MRLSNGKAEDAAIAMQEARAWLDAHGFRYRFLPPHQLKIGLVNFWPGTGTITIDGELEKRPVKGLTGLESILITGDADATKARSTAAPAARSKLRLLG